MEHVHVLEKAKKRTDEELKNIKKEMEDLAGYVKTLERIRDRLTGEAEDLTRQKDLERQHIRNKEKDLKRLEEKATRAAIELEREKKLREATEVQNSRLQTDIKTLQADLSNRKRERKVLLEVSILWSKS